MEGTGTKSCSVFSSIENANFKCTHMKSSRRDQLLANYDWHRPERPIVDRKRQTDSRREELLNLLYQDTITTSQAEEMVKEWLSLVVERDRLLREQLDMENREDKVEYFRQLKQFLKEQPVLGDGNEEVNIREALINLEKHVMQYCREHQITSPPPPDSKVQLQGSRQGRATNGVDYTGRGALHQFLHQQDILDHETGQTGIPIEIVGDSSHSSAPHSRHNSSSTEDYHCGIIHTTATASKSQTRTKEQETKVNFTQTMPAVEVVRRPRDHNVQANIFSGLVIPPVPPLPLTIPPSSSQLHTVTHSSAHTGGTVAGTVQFASSNTYISSNLETQMDRRVSYRSGLVSMDISSTDRSRVSMTATSMVHPDPPMECPSSEERQQLMDEIATVGQSVLRRTSQPKSPGGTPLKHSRNRLTLTGNTDLLQRALISKFRSLHSTPLRHHSAAEVDKSGSLDLSCAWSDINSSSPMYEDPDLSSTPSSALVQQNRCSLFDSRTDLVDPNSSTAV